MAHCRLLITLFTITFSVGVHSKRVSECLNQQEALKTLSKSALEGCLTQALSPAGRVGSIRGARSITVPQIIDPLKECLKTALENLLSGVKTCLQAQPPEQANVEACLPTLTEAPQEVTYCISAHADISQPNLEDLKSCLQTQLQLYLQGKNTCLVAAIGEQPAGDASESSETTDGAVKVQTMLSGSIAALGLPLLFI